MKKKFKILLDNGHGKETPGKRSPDGTLMEWEYCREIAKLVLEQLTNEGYDTSLVTPEDKDINLGIRCKRINKVCSEYGSSNVLLISIHCNAAGSDNKWHNASGWSGWIYSKASDKSKLLALLLYELAEKLNLKGNRWVPKEKYWTAQYYILKNTNCPAVLTENLFQDNKEDVKLLLSDEGKQKIVKLHVEAIKEYINRL